MHQILWRFQRTSKQNGLDLLLTQGAQPNASTISQLDITWSENTVEVYSVWIQTLIQAASQTAYLIQVLDSQNVVFDLFRHRVVRLIDN